MHSVIKLAGSLLAGVLAFLAVGIGVTEALAPYVWPSLMLGLPAGIAAGGATAPLLLGGLPAGIVSATVAAYLVSRRDWDGPTPPGSTSQ